MPSYFVSYTYIDAKGPAFGSCVIQDVPVMTPETYAEVRKQAKERVKASEFVILSWQRFEEPDA